MGLSGECISAFTAATAASGILRCLLDCYSRRDSFGQRTIADREKLKHDFENRGALRTGSYARKCQGYLPHAAPTIFPNRAEQEEHQTGRHILESGKVAYHFFQAIRLFVQDADLLAETIFHDASAVNNFGVATAYSF